MFPLSQSLKFAAGGAIFALAAAAHSPYADTMTQISGLVGPRQFMINTVGSKRVTAFYVPSNGTCNVYAVILNDDDRADVATVVRVRISLNPAQTVSLDSSATETLTLKCGDHAESLSALDSDQQVVAK